MGRRGPVSAAGAASSNATTGTPGLVQLAQDLGGTATAPTVLSLTGVAGTLAIASTAAILSWAAASASPKLTQTIQASDIACNNLTIQPQAPFASATGTNRASGSLIFNIPAVVAGGTIAQILHQYNGASYLTETFIAGGSFRIAGTANINDLIIGSTATANTLALQAATSVTLNGTSFIFASTGGATGLTVSASGAAAGTVTWAAVATSVAYTQAANTTTTGVNTTITAQAGASTFASGDLKIGGGVAAGGGGASAAGYVDFTNQAVALTGTAYVGGAAIATIATFGFLPVKIAGTAVKLVVVQT